MGIQGSIHASVLLTEVIELLQPRSGGLYIDATCGLGGHTEPIKVEHPSAPSNGSNGFKPYHRDPETLGRPWAIPGTPGLEHRLGGLAKQPESGNVSYNPAENEQMVQQRALKVARLAEVIPEQEVVGPQEGDLIVVSWGSTFGAVRSAVNRLLARGEKVSHAHIRYINPFPSNLGKLLSKFDRILVPEMNMGQLSVLLHNKYDAVVARNSIIPFGKVQGRPFKVSEIRAKIEEFTGK